MESVHSQKHSGAREVNGIPYTPTPPESESNIRTRNGNPVKPLAIALPQWDELCAAAGKAGMAFDPNPESYSARILWRRLTAPARAAAIDGIAQRVACGEYDPVLPYTHKLQNYLAKRIWQEGLRPQSRGAPPKRGVGSAMQRLAKGATGND